MRLRTQAAVAIDHALMSVDLARAPLRIAMLAPPWIPIPADGCGVR